MTKWKKTKVSQFLFEREGKYKPDACEIVGLKRIEKIDFQGKIHIGKKPSKTNMILVNNGDLVISGINVSKGALAIYEGKEPVIATIHYSSYTFDKKQIHIEYLKRFLKSPKFIELLKEQVRGGIKTEIKPKHILALEIKLPSIVEQEKIIDDFRRIETEDSELKAEILYQKTLVRKLRQQILQDAIEGKLTENWRVDNPDIEPASKLLKRIKEKKKETLKNKKEKKLSSISEKEKLFVLPKGWAWSRLGELACPLRGITYGIVKMGQKPKQDGVYALRCSDVKYRKFDLSGVRKVSEKISNQYKRTILEGNEILLNIRGTLGGCSITTPEMKGYNIAREIGLIPLLDKRLNDFTLDVLTSKYFDDQIKNNLRGIAYKGLNLNILNKLPIPIPPIEEQELISEKVKFLLAICDKLESQIIQNQKYADQLMQAVLKEAFSQTKNKTHNIDNVIEFKLTSYDDSDYNKSTLLAAEIVHQLHREPTLGHKKFQKVFYLCQKTQNLNLPTNFKKHAAGPYDYDLARDIDTALQRNDWFIYRGTARLKYKPLSQIGSHKEDLQKYFKNELAGINQIISLFKTKTSDEAEAVATLYACWEEILNSGMNFSNSALIEKFYGWSEEKGKFSERQLNQVITWMEKHEIHPKQSEAAC